MFDFLARTFSSIFSQVPKNGMLDEKGMQAMLERVKDGLLEADVPHGLVQEFVQSLQAELVLQKLPKGIKQDEFILKIVHDKLLGFLGGKQLPFQYKKIATVLVMGLQGSGKTTTIAKLAFQQKNSRKVLLASVDFYRPAALDQLAILAQKASVDFYRASSNDPVVAAREIMHYAQAQGYDLLFLDTSGRLHVDNAMLTELQLISTNLQPSHKLLVLDAMTGQESLAIARAFDQVVGFDGAILTKMDSDTRGGAAFSFKYALKKPIYFVTTGEKLEDIAFFYPERAAGRMLGMGDIQTLLEQADQKIKKSEQEAASRALESGTFTLQDFLKQMEMMAQLGSLTSVMKYIPGLAGQISQEQLEQGEREMKRFKAIISSMTPKERVYPVLLNDSRLKRVAQGAGVRVSDVSQLIKRFEQMQQYAKLIKKSGGLPPQFRRR